MPERHWHERPPSGRVMRDSFTRTSLMRRLHVCFMLALGACSAGTTQPAGPRPSKVPAAATHVDSSAFPDPFLLPAPETSSPAPPSELQSDSLLLHFRYVPGRLHRLEGGAGRIIVQNTISTPNPCHTLESRASRRGMQLTLRIIARRRPVGCVADYGHFEYQIVLGNLPPGAYRVEVLHEYPDSPERWSGPALAGPVVVH